jgi:hypothetical protein
MILPYFLRLLSSQIIPQKCGFARQNRDRHGSFSTTIDNQLPFGATPLDYPSGLGITRLAFVPARVAPWSSLIMATIAKLEKEKERKARAERKRLKRLERRQKQFSNAAK